jgi:pimeloyl-ACP methyl ester carboxylesterase
VRAVGVLALGVTASTALLVGDEGEPLADSIAVVEAVELGGMEQWISIRALPARGRRSRGASLSVRLVRHQGAGHAGAAAQHRLARCSGGECRDQHDRLRRPRRLGVVSDLEAIMEQERTHRAVSRDGTQIVAHVHGDGRPLVLVSGSGDGHNDPFLLPELAEHFTCYSVSLRSHGLSEASSDQAPERHVEDIAAVVDSVGGPVGVAAHSRGAALALSAVAQAEAVDAVALYEPHVIELYGPEDVARADGAIERMQAAASRGDLAEAAEVFFEEITLPNPQELAILSESGAFDSIAPIMADIVSEISQWQLPRSPDSLPLDEINVPVLLLHGNHSHRFYADVIEHLGTRLPNAEVHEVAECGHFSPWFTPAPIADRIVEFFEAAPEPA